MSDKKFPPDPKDKKKSNNRMYGLIALLAGIALLFVGFSFKNFGSGKVQSLIFGAVLVVIGAVMLLRGIDPAENTSVPGEKDGEEIDPDIRTYWFMDRVWRIVKILTVIVLAVWLIADNLRRGISLQEMGTEMALLLLAAILLLNAAMRRRKR